MRGIGFLRRQAAHVLRAPASAVDEQQLNSQLEAVAARLEKHTVNLAEHEAQLRDETIRQIINEVRANSSFLAQSVVALDRAEARRADLVHAAVRPLVHTTIAGDDQLRTLRGNATEVIIVDHVDPVLVDELVVDGRAVAIVEPAIDYPLPRGVVVSTVAISRFRGPREPVRLVVWVRRRAPTLDELVAVRSWIAPGGALITAGPDSFGPAGGFWLATERAYFRTNEGLRRVELGESSEPTVHPATVGAVTLHVGHYVAQ